MVNLDAWRELDDIDSLLEAMIYLYNHIGDGKEHAIALADVEVDFLQDLLREKIKVEKELQNKHDINEYCLPQALRNFSDKHRISVDLGCPNCVRFDSWTFSMIGNTMRNRGLKIDTETSYSMVAIGEKDEMVTELQKDQWKKDWM